MATYYFFIGHPQVGKTTSAKILSKHLGFEQGSTSTAVYRQLAKERGITVEQLYALNKEEIRPELMRVGDAICAISPTGLVDALVRDDIRIIDGIRRQGELQESVAKLRREGHNAWAIWVNNNRRPIIHDNTSVTEADADFSVDNHGTFDELESKLLALVAKLPA